MEMIFCPLVTEHLDEAVSIHQQCLPMPWSKQIFEESLQDGSQTGLAVQIDTVLIGFVIGRTVKEEAEILTLVVSKAWQRKGIGTKLLRSFLKNLVGKGTRTVLLEVKASNAVALELYKSFGFEKVGEREKYYTALEGHLRTAEVLQKIF